MASYDFETVQPFDTGTGTAGLSTFSFKEGAKALFLSGSGGFVQRWQDEDSYSRGSAFLVSGWIRSARSDDGLGLGGAGFMVGGTGANGEGYQCMLDYRALSNAGIELQIREDFDFASRSVGDTFSHSDDAVWLWGEVTWSSAGVITFSVYDDDGGTLLGDVSRTDSTYTSGFVGVTAYGIGRVDTMTVIDGASSSINAAASLSISITGSSAASAVAEGSGTGQVSITGQSDASSTIEGDGAAAVQITSSSTGSAAISGIAAGSVSISSLSGGSSVIEGQASGLVSISVSASNSDGVGSGDFSGSVEITGSSSANLVALGSSALSVAISGSSSGVSSISAAQAAAVTISLVAVGRPGVSFGTPLERTISGNRDGRIVTSLSRSRLIS